MSELQTLMYYLYEYEQNENNIEAKEYLDNLMVNMIAYCNEVLRYKTGISMGYKILKFRTIISFGRRPEYDRIFAAIDREFADLIKYLKVVRTRTKKLQEIGSYEAIDMLYVLLIFCEKILNILDGYTDTIVKLNNKNNGGESIFLPVNFDSEAKENKEAIDELVKSLG